MRVVIGTLLILLARRMIRNRSVLEEVYTYSFFPYGRFFVWYVSVLQIGIGLLLIAGFLTQIAALLLMLLCLKHIVMYQHLSHPLLPKRLSYVLFFVCAFSLFVTGPGAFAIDLPI